jgi:hypothetical protein
MSKIEKHNKRVLATITDYKEAFRSPHGQRVLQHLIDMYMTKTSHVEGDPHSTAFNEGARNVVLMIIKKLKLDIGQLQEMLEHQEEEEDVRDII